MNEMVNCHFHEFFIQSLEGEEEVSRGYGLVDISMSCNLHSYTRRRLFSYLYLNFDFILSLPFSIIQEFDTSLQTYDMLTFSCITKPTNLKIGY